MGNKLNWVSEWRIEPDNFLKYKVTNGGVYTPADDLEEARAILKRNILDEQRNYRINNLKCPNCEKTFSQHQGMIDYRNCLLQLAVDGVRK